MTQIVFPSPYPPQDVAGQAVYNRVDWGDAWYSAGNLWCERLSLSTGETISSASFRWKFGQHLAPGGNAWSSIPVLSINPRSFCRVDFTGTAGRASFRWYGVWQRAEKQDNEQRFQAVGLEQLLDTPCLDLPFWNTVSAELCWAGRGLGFNVGGPNRGSQQTINGQTVYVFSNDPECEDYWTTRDAVQLLLAAAAPLDSAGDKIFDWIPDNAACLPDFDRPEIATHGRTFLELLRSLVPRYRLLGWTVEPGAEQTMSVRFFTFAETDIILYDQYFLEAGFIPANANLDDLVFTYDQSSAASLVTEASHVADQVVARGDRRQIVCTLSVEDGSLEGKWTTAEGTDYLQGASGADDYPPDDEVRLQQERDRDARNVEALRHVFCWFGPPHDWDQTTADGQGVETPQPIAVDEEDNQFWLYVPELIMGDSVPKEIDADHYTEDIPLLVFVKAVYATNDPSGIDRWVTADQMGRCADLEQQDDDNARKWSLSVRPMARDRQSRLWVEMRVHGAEQHAIASSWFVSREDGVVGAIDYNADIVLTVCLEETRHVEARWPADEDIAPLGQLVNRLILDAPGYRYVDVRPNTIKWIEERYNRLVRHEGGIVVDDTDELLLIAQRTYQWHAIPRYALGLSTGWIDAAIQIGHLVTAMTDATSTYPVRSVITEITLDFPISQSTTPQRPTMSITTAFAEMDAQRIV
jgi:hypothetical protein